MPKPSEKDLLTQKVLETTTLYEVSKILGSSLELKKSLRQVLKILHDFMGMGRGTLALLDPASAEKGRELSIEAAYGLTKEEIEKGRYKIGEGIMGKVVKTGSPIIIPDVGQEPLFLNKTGARKIDRENIAFLCVPVVVKGEIIGVLSVDRLFHGKAVSFREDVRLLSVIASLIGQAVKLVTGIEAEKQHLIDEKNLLQRELKGRFSIKNVVGNSIAMQEVADAVEMVSRSRATVLLRGESGTGKELVARAIHYNSPRAKKPFIKLNCAALPETLLEGELFGHEKGAFTGADRERKGRFELADGGTLFLDEIGDIPASTQVKLLRVLQERKFERLGGSKTITVDIRLIAATNRNLEKAVGEGTFREDLYYRLNVVPIHLPPLRERREDIPLLVDHFLSKFGEENKKAVTLAPDALDAMVRYPWPGNIRELENCVERLVVMARRKAIAADDLPLYLKTTPLLTQPAAFTQSTSSTKSMSSTLAPATPTLKSSEKELLLKALEEAEGNQTKAAEMLGITPRQIGYKLKKFGIRARFATEE